MKKYLVAFILFTFYSCNDIVKEIIESSIQTKKRKEQLVENNQDFPISKDHVEIIKRIKHGEDSLLYIKNFFLDNTLYSEGWFTGENVYDSTHIYYYKNGKKSHVLTYKKGLLMSLDESYLPDGKKRNEPLLKGGTGTLCIYHPLTFALILRCGIKDGKKHGSFQSFYSNGNSEEESTFINDSAVGNYKLYYKTGALKSTRVLANGEGEGTFEEFYENGGLKSKVVYSNHTPIESTSYNENEDLTEKDFLRNDSVVKQRWYYNEKNVLSSKGTYIDEKKEGAYYYYFENGKPRILEQYLHDELQLEKKWYENGVIKWQYNYRSNAKHGTALEYYDNGKLRLSQQYENGLKHGKYLSYYENGQLYNEGAYLHDKPIGPWKFFTREGKYKGTNTYE
jgi:uncharacterized protein